MIIFCFKLLKNTKISGITLFPFILLRKKEDLENKTLINHEKIHFYQQLELLIIPFYIWYFVEFFINYIKYRNVEKAYKTISFEKEAYQNDQNLSYIKTRKFWNFISYL